MSHDAYESHDEPQEEEYYEDTTDDEYFDEDETIDVPLQDDFRTPLRPVAWRRIRIGNMILEISDSGRIKPSGSLFGATKGYPLIGTPYLTYPVELEHGNRKEYYMHDLVWQAFNGQPPEGWEVRHTFDEASKRRKYYNNALASLTITPATVEVRPSLSI